MTVQLQTQGIHHITLNGADRNTSINFWQDVLGMKLIFEQPNLDDPNINHLYFDCGDGRTITVFSSDNLSRRRKKTIPSKNQVGAVHHIAFWVSQSVIRIAKKKLERNGFPNSGIKDRGFMDSLYFREPLGLLIELASYKFDPPFGFTHGQVLQAAHQSRVERDVQAIEDEDIANAIRVLTEKKIH